MPEGAQRSRLMIGRGTPRRGKQAESLQPPTFGTVVVLQWNRLQRYWFPIATPRGGDHYERARTRTGLDPAPQGGLKITVRVRDRNDDFVVFSWR